MENYLLVVGWDLAIDFFYAVLCHNHSILQNAKRLKYGGSFVSLFVLNLKFFLFLCVIILLVIYIKPCSVCHSFYCGFSQMTLISAGASRIILVKCTGQLSFNSSLDLNQELPSCIDIYTLL